MPYASEPVAGTSIYYEVDGDGPRVVFVPGGGGNHASWWQQAPFFRDRYKLITVDWPGYGLSRSAAEQFDILEWPDAIRVVLDDLGIDRAVVVAQSLGGMPTLMFGVQNPTRVAGLVLCSSVGTIRDEEFRSVWLADRTAADRAEDRAALIFREKDPAAMAKSALFRAVASFNQAKPASGNIVNQRSDKGVSFGDLRELIGRGVPLWFLWGDNDRTRQTSTYELLGRYLPEAHVERLAGQSHAFYWEAPEVFNEALERALAEIYAGEEEQVTVGAG